MSMLEEGIYGSTSGGRNGLGGLNVRRQLKKKSNPSNDLQTQIYSDLYILFLIPGYLAAGIPTLYPMISETMISNNALVSWADLQPATTTPIGMDSPSLVVRFFRCSTATAPGKQVVLVAPEVRRRLSAIRTHTSNLSREIREMQGHS